MDITVYLPDEIGERAKAAELNLSRMLRDAVTDELYRRATMSETLSETQTYEVDIETDTGYGAGPVVTGRITGTQIAHTDSGVQVFLTDDDRVLVYSSETLKYWESDNPVEELRDLLGDADYVDAMHDLGIKPVIDL